MRESPQDNLTMPSKDPAQMSHAERMAMLMHELSSPSCVSKADKVLELIKHEWLDVMSVREMATRRLGDDSAPPPPPFVQAAANEATVNPKERGLMDGTLGGLILAYKTDNRSSFHELRYKTREIYSNKLRRMEHEIGGKKLIELDRDATDHLYSVWSGNGLKLSAGHSMIALLRVLANFGDTVLNDPDSQRLALVLHRMQLPTPRPRKVLLTEQHVDDIIVAAHELGHHSIALTQAFQADCKIRQRDVIGEWVPIESSDGDSNVTFRDEKWLRGIRWENLERPSLILHHALSFNQKAVSFDLKKCPRVMAELNRIGIDSLPTEGPIVVSDLSGLPWRTMDFRRVWRKAARAAGVPDEVKNSDSSRLSENDAASDDEDDDAAMLIADDAEEDAPQAMRH